MEPIIEFKNFSYKYRSQQEPTLFDINLKIYPGEKILIVGPSGCGKSTLAHCLNALNPCSYKGEITGTLTVDGKVPEKEGVFGMSKTVGTVLQDTNGQFIGLTVAEDLAFALENDAVEQEEIFRRVNEAARIVEMENYLRQAPTQLSGGQKQRVSVGGVLVDNVKILLFDEPLAALDPLTGKRTIALIDRLRNEQNVTVVIIEHRIEDALYRDVDRVIVMSEGRIVADERPDELLASDVLVKEGVREPLYVTAVKHTGARIDPADRPQHIETMNIEPYRQRLHEWFEETEIPQRLNRNPYVLEAENLTFAYREGQPILKDISFKVRRGEILSIVGKNGAGKSTLASLICGFYKPDAGVIRLDGEDISPLSIKERGENIGFVMQTPSQMISKPMISEEVGLGLAVRGVPQEEITERVNRTLKICGLYPFRNWPVSALSYGQKKRVTIASILVMEPKILILDEPTAGQDYRHYTEIMEFLKKLNEEMGLTIIMITHDMHLMLEYTDRALVLSDGDLIADDLPAKILSNKEIAAKAYLKETSLYELAVKAGFEDPSGFVDRFILFERQHGEQAKAGAHDGKEGIR